MGSGVHVDKNLCSVRARFRIRSESQSIRSCFAYSHDSEITSIYVGQVTERSTDDR